MSKTENLSVFLKDVADTIRNAEGSSNLINPQHFSNRIVLITGGTPNEQFDPAKKSDINVFMKDIADTIRGVEGSINLINPQDFSSKIKKLTGGEVESPNLVCVYDIVDTSRQTQIMASYASHAYTSMIVDGVEMDFDCYYQFDTEGLHTVEFIFDEEYKTELPGQGFEYVTQLVSITIPESITSIPYDAIGYRDVDNLEEFKGKYASKDGKCLIIDGKLQMSVKKGLASYVIPDDITSIGQSAFYFRNDLTSVTIGNSVTTIGEHAFYGCESLTSVYCKATTPPALDWNVFSYNGSDRKIYVPMESVEAYKSAQYWSDYADAIVGYNF